MIKGRRAPTSEVFDFAFDLDTKQKRQDAGKFQVRVDYSNTNGYWNAAVDSPGIASDSVTKRFWSPAHGNWRTQVDGEKHTFNLTFEESKISEDFNIPIYWGTADDCEVGGENYELGFGAHVEGSFEADFTYGFSMVVRKMPELPPHFPQVSKRLLTHTN